ncbi:probable WRKY transcription factor 53 [Impatiens glandulifera]|uniref:probable WRKY transcription factor 53 n=1 Tax=Impatiens glandulifera TaxID=253017 RepID=UPI001FB08ADC|nr:probable WRKY transcription factor 53 [Impatiens glandulifera]
MENECKWDHTALISELKQGMELANQLNLHLNLPSSSSSSIANGSQQLLLQRILSSYDNALFILQWRKNNNNKISPPTPPPPPPPPSLLESSSSPEISPRLVVEEDLPKSPPSSAIVSRKRKASSNWTNNVTIRSENGLESPCEDGHSWRKYGQKDILGAKYPRSYYRCTYRNVQNCWATKQVQRSDEDPTLFEINYKGKHTCTMRNSFQSSSSSNSPRTPQKQINKQPNNNNHDNEMLLNLRKNLRVDTNNDNDHTIPSDFPSTSFDQISLDYTFSTFFDDNLLGGYSPKFLSPANSDSNYFFSDNSSERNGFGAVNDISNNSSVSNSPVVGLDFSIDRIGLDDFEFDHSGFFR